MKLLISAHGFPPLIGGIESQLYPLADEFNRLGLNVRVLTPKIKYSRQFDYSSKINVIRIPGGLATAYRRPRFTRLIVYAIYFLRQLIVFKPDVVFSSTWQPYGPIIVTLARIFNFSSHFQVHGVEILTAQDNWLHKKLMIYTLKRSNGIFAMGSFQLKNLVKLGINKEKISIILDGTDPIKFRSGLDSSHLINKHNLKGKKIILTVSNLYPHKGQDKIIKTLPKIVESVPNIVYLIIGKGPQYNYLKSLSAKYGVKDKVIFTGYVDNDDLPYYYNLCDIFVMLSKEVRGANTGTEGYGLVFVEANACGKPTIGSRSGGIYDAIINGETGYLINSEDTNEILDKITLLCNNKELSLQLGQNGRARIESELNYKQMTLNILGVMQNKVI